METQSEYKGFKYTKNKPRGWNVVYPSGFKGFIDEELSEENLKVRVDELVEHGLNIPNV